MNDKTRESCIQDLIDKLVDFQEAHINLVRALENVDSDDEIWNKETTSLYPYENSLEEYTISIIDWVQAIKEAEGY